MSHPTDLATALLEADGSTRESLLRDAEAGRLESAIVALGHRREPAAAEVLSLVDVVVDDPALRKAARRELHRLRSAGIEPPAQATARAPSDASSPVRSGLTITEAWATDVDPTGSRALWLLGERPLGGAWLAATLLNDQRGLQDLSLVDTTRKRFQRELAERRRDPGAVWVSLPGEYALRLVREAVDLTRERGVGLPTRYHAFREVFGEAPGAPERALAYETISPVQVSFNPDWLEQGQRLLSEQEVSGWHIAVPEQFRSRALEVLRGSTSALLVPGNPPEQQALTLLADAATEALTPAVRRGLRRRLEETAYIFASSDRLSLARLAVAAARALDDLDLPLERQPFARALLSAGLARLVASEAIGGRRASELLVEMIERASEARAEGGTAAGARPSGLILPR